MSGSELRFWLAFYSGLLAYHYMAGLERDTLFGWMWVVAGCIWLVSSAATRGVR